MLKLLVTDMDGTFLSKKNEFDKKRFQKLLENCARKKYMFVAASGRPLLNLMRLFKGFEDQIGFIADNGSVVYFSGKIIFEDVMAPETVREITKKLLICPYLKQKHFLVSSRTNSYVCQDVDQDYIEHISYYYENVRKVSDFNDIDDEIIKATARFDKGSLEKGEAWVNQEIPSVTAVTTGLESIDIVKGHISKASGIEHLCRYLGTEVSKVIAFGDNFNDFELLQCAGRAVATGNAKEAIKQIADEVIGPCTEESVINYMEDLVANNNY